MFRSLTDYLCGFDFYSFIFQALSGRAVQSAKFNTVILSSFAYENKLVEIILPHSVLQ